MKTVKTTNAGVWSGAETKKGCAELAPSSETAAPSGGRDRGGFGVWVLMIDGPPIHFKSFTRHYVRPKGVSGVSGIRTRAELKKGCADWGVRFLPATQNSPSDRTFQLMDFGNRRSWFWDHFSRCTKKLYFTDSPKMAKKHYTIAYFYDATVTL